jgi:hypothetical protein
MNYYTLFYLIIILFMIFKNHLFSKIIDFNTKNNTEYILKNILKDMNTKNLIIILFTFYLIYQLKFIYKSVVLICSIIIYFNYTKINFTLNQLMNIYYNNFLINKFLLV